MCDLLNIKINKLFWLIILVVLLSSFFGFMAGLFATLLFQPIQEPEVKVPITFQEQLVIDAVRNVSPAVVSIVVTRDLPAFEWFFEPIRTERREAGSGTGFIVSQEGLILTNKHVVLDEEAEYTVIDNDGNKFTAQVLARDPLQDLAVLKIEGEAVFEVVNLGDSDSLQTGQTVIAIGNVLGEFRNSVSLGVVSGLGRTITASGGGMVQVLEDVIQTDAAINPGNSGGPLLNLKGEVIGINTAMAIAGENIGFAIPVNRAKKAIEQVKTLGRIVYPFLGVRYVVIDQEIQQEEDLPVDYGAWVISSRGEPAIFPGSAAEEAGLQENDIILEFDNQKITTDNHLRRIIVKYDPGDEVVLRVLRDKEEKIINVVLREYQD